MTRPARDDKRKLWVVERKLASSRDWEPTEFIGFDPEQARILESHHHQYLFGIPTRIRLYRPAEEE